MSETSSPAPRASARSVFGVLLIVLAVGAVAYGLIREATRSRLAEGGQRPAVQSDPASGLQQPATLSQPGQPDSPQSVESTVTTVYYFHGDTRCDTCLAIEAQAGEAVQSKFAQDISSGRLRFLSVNFDEPEHRHFREDFDLSFGSVVVSRDTRFENLAEVWTLIHEERSEFDAYVAERVAEFMKVAP